MNAPDPKANTTTEAYLAYKAGFLEESELKPVLYEPYLHFDAWLAYWCGLAPLYPIKSAGKNKFNKYLLALGKNWSGVIEQILWPFDGAQKTRAVGLIPVKPNTTYTVTLASSEWYLMEINSVDNEFVLKSKISNINNNEYTRTLTTGEHICFLGFKFKYGSAGTAEITKEMLSELKLQVELGDTATSYEDYTGEPEMLTDEEALVAYLSGVTDTYPEEIKDPYDVRIVGYLRHLASIRWPEPDYPVNNEEFYLSTMEPTHTSNPVPSSDIELDTAEGKIISVEAYGDTYQQTYSGKNLFSVGFYSAFTANNDNTFTLTKPSQRTALFSCPTNLPAGTYTLSGVCSEITTTKAVAIQFRNGQSGLGSTTISETGSFTLTVTTTLDITDIYVYIANSDNDGVSITFTKMQLESGSTPTAYEPYVGGIPAPNPDYPQAVQVVTGAQNVQVHGKNLCKEVYLSNNNRNLNFSMVRPSSNTITLSATINLTLSGNSIYLIVDSTNYGAITTMSGTAGQLQKKTITFTEEQMQAIENATIIRLYIYRSGGGFEVPTDGQIEEGSIATAYEPYQSQSYEIDLTGKNLLDSLDGYIDGYISSDGTIGAGGGVNALFDYMSVDFSSTYTLSASETTRMSFAYFDESKTFISRDANIDGDEYTITTPANCKYVRVWVYRTLSAGGITQSYLESLELQFEKGSQATSYVPYYNYELCKIGTHQDYIYKSGGDWYVHKETGKVTYNGSETWMVSNNSRYAIAKPSGWDTWGTNVSTYPSKGYSTHLLPGDSGTVDNSFNVGGTNVFIRAPGKGTGLSNTTTWKTWLTSNNLTIYSILATPTDTKITDATLVGQLEALAGADTYNEKTYIKVTATDPNLPALLKVEAYKY